MALIPHINDGWRAVLEMAWEAKRVGSIPIGASVVDPKGVVKAIGRNMTSDRESHALGQLSNTNVAHAEINALAQIKRDAPRDYTLLTSLGPCAMCMVGAGLARIKQVTFAAGDPTERRVTDIPDAGPRHRIPPSERTDIPEIVDFSTFLILRWYTHYSRHYFFQQFERTCPQWMIEMASTKEADFDRTDKVLEALEGFLKRAKELQKPRFETAHQL